MTNSLNFYEKFISPSTISGMPDDTPILVAFSGGADSTALLHMLVEHSKNSKAKIYAAHVNHMIRGAEADRDEEFCKNLASSLGVELFVLRRDVPLFASEAGLSIETAARNVRYDFFDEIMKEHDIPILATAHNANDNLETVIFNMTRGSGPSGICGIPRSRPCKNGTVIRPILDISKEEIFEYCRLSSLKYVTDSTNVDTDYTRNKIRAQIIPSLMEINSGLIENVSRLTKTLTEDELCLQSLADWFLDEMNEDASFDIQKLLGSPIAVTSRAIIALYKSVSGGESLEYTHIKAIRALCKSATPHSKINLPADVDAVIEQGRLYIVKRESTPTPAPEFSVTLSEGAVSIPRINAEITIENSQSPINIYKKSTLLYLDFDRINGTLIARNRRAGDKIKLHGVNKSVKKLLCDLKIPLSLRYRLPMICDDSGIVAIPFAAIADGYEKKDKQDALHLRLNLLE